MKYEGARLGNGLLALDQGRHNSAAYPGYTVQLPYLVVITSTSAPPLCYPPSGNATHAVDALAVEKTSGTSSATSGEYRVKQKSGGSADEK